MNHEVNPVRSALYYPYPFVQSDDWLKFAVLFFDRIYRIIPAGFEYMEEPGGIRVMEPSSTARLFNDEFHFINNYVVSSAPWDTWDQPTLLASAALAELMDEFPEYFRKKMSRKQEYFSWGRLELTKLNHSAIHSLRERDALIEDEPTSEPSLFIQELYDDPDTVFRLSSVSGSSRAFRFKDFPGRVYMALLAKYIGKYENLPVVTDDLSHDKLLKSVLFASHSLRTRILEDDYAYNFPEIKTELNHFAAQPRIAMALCNLVFDSIGIQDISNVSPDKIVQIRKKYDDERKAFVEKVESSLRDLEEAGINSHRQLTYYLKDKAEKIDKARRDYEMVIRGSGVKTTLSLGTMSFSVPLLEYLSKYITIPHPLSIGAAGAMGIGLLLYKTREQRIKERRANPVGFYLFELGRTLNRRSYIQRLRRSLSSFARTV